MSYGRDERDKARYAEAEAETIRRLREGLARRRGAEIDLRDEDRDEVVVDLSEEKESSRS